MIFSCCCSSVLVYPTHHPFRIVPKRGDRRRFLQRRRVIGHIELRLNLQQVNRASTGVIVDFVNGVINASSIGRIKRFAFRRDNDLVTYNRHRSVELVTVTHHRKVVFNPSRPIVVCIDYLDIDVVRAESECGTTGKRNRVIPVVIEVD